MRKKSLSSKKLRLSIAQLALDKKAENIKILDMRKVANFCDYFIICSGGTDRHTRAIANNIDLGLKELGLRIQLKQGFQSGEWVLLDIGDIVIHIFQKQTRDFYQLEHLWQEAKEVPWEGKK